MRQRGNVLTCRAVFAASVVFAATSFAADLDAYRFRYDFTSGAVQFYGSAAQPGSATANGELTGFTTTGPDGHNTAVTPTSEGWGVLTDGLAALNDDWTLAVSLCPGSIENGILLTLGRLNTTGRKCLGIGSSTEPGKINFYVFTRTGGAGTRTAEKTLTLGPGEGATAAGFHSVMVVHHADSGNKGLLEFYIDGVKYSSYTMTTAIQFGDVLQFCGITSGLFGSYVGTEGDPSIAFRDVRLYSEALTAADAAKYAELFPASSLRHSASIRAYGTNYVDTAYYTTPETRYAADFQYMSLVKQYRIFGARGDHGCNLYLNASTAFAYAMQDNGGGWSSFGVAGNTRRGYAALDRENNSAILYMDGVTTTKTLGGTGTKTASIPTQLFADKQTVDGKGTDLSNAMIYSLGIDTNGVPAHFFVPATNDVGEAGFYDVIAGEFKGESNPDIGAGQPMTFSDGLGSASDYKYEDGILYAKFYVATPDDSRGSVQCAAGNGGEEPAVITPEADGGIWAAYGTNLTLTATAEDGYEFKGWFGDVRIIQGGYAATDATVVVSIDKASQLEARFAPIVPEVNYNALAPRFAKRAQDFDVGDYVQDNLIAHFDGIRNAGAAAPHDPSATTWANLGSLGSAQNATKTNASTPPTGAAAGEWTDDGYLFKGLEYFAIGGTIALGGAATAQVVVDYENSEQLVNYPAFIGATSSNSDQYFLYFNRKDSTEYEKRKLRFKLLTKTTHAASTTYAGGPFVNAIYDDANGRVSVGESLPAEWQTSNASGELPAWSYAIGTAQSGNSQKQVRMLVGTMHAVRLYTQVLTDEQLAWNRLVDEARFQGKVEENVVVESNGIVDGAEPGGAYMVNGDHTFTAPNVVKDGREWTATGYSLDTWDSANGRWKRVGDFSETSYAYTNSAAFGKVRITWNWRLASGVKKLDADDYAQSGLMLNFDGFSNAGLGVHDSTATAWANLGSLGSAADAVNTDLDSSLWHALSKPGAWEADGYRFGSRNWFATTNTVSVGYDETTQIVADYDCVAQKAMYTNSSGTRWPAMFGATDANNVLNLYLNIDGASNSGDNVFSYSHGGWRTSGNSWDGRFVNRFHDTWEAHKVTIAASSGAGWNTGSTNMDGNKATGSHTFGIGHGGSTAISYIFYGKVRAVRMYDRILTDAEVARNRAIDEARFFGRLAGLDETDVVLVKSESPAGAVRLESEGAYIVRNAAHTFTAPATFSGDLATYSCAGYRLETWNATTKLWEVSATSSELTAELSSAGAAANRRLIWLWRMDSGLRTAAGYTTDDYVQSGLAAHFDGIRNYGEANSHYVAAAKWVNLVDGGPDATKTTITTNASVVIAGGETGEWHANGYRLKGLEYFPLASTLTLGSAATTQIAADYEHSEQIVNYPAFFGATASSSRDDFVIYFNRYNGSATDKLTPYFKLHHANTHKAKEIYSGPYTTAIYDDASGKVSISNKDQADWQTSNASGALPAWKYAIGTGRDTDAQKKVRLPVATMKSVRVYAKVLSDAEIAQNRKVDEIRFDNAFTNYVNLVVAYGENEDGVEATASVPAGEYEVTGSWTLTAGEVRANGGKYVPKVYVDTWNGSGWVSGGRTSGRSYTATDSGKVRLTYTWKRKRGFTIIVR